MNITKKLLIMTVAIMMGTMSAIAEIETVIQVEPFKAAPEVARKDKAFFNVRLIAPVQQQSLQFDLKLPSGMEVYDVKCPTSINMPANATTAFNKIDEEENIYRFVFWNRLPAAQLRQKDMVVLQVYYTFEDEIASILQTIKTTNALLVTKDFKESYPDVSCSFMHIDAEGLTSCKFSDYSGMEGYVPSFVCAEMNKKTNADITLSSLLLQNIDSLYSPINVRNNNALIYCKAHSKAYDMMIKNRALNTVAVDDNGSGTAEEIYLLGENEDFAAATEAGDFAVVFPTTTKKFTLKRTFPSKIYSSVYLPVNIDGQTYNEVFGDNDITVYKIVDSDVIAQYVTFEPTKQLEAHKPYFTFFNGERNYIQELTNVTLPASPKNGGFKVKTTTMYGTYARGNLASTSAQVCYAFDSKDGIYKRVAQYASNVIVNPFRAYIAVPKAAFKVTALPEEGPEQMQARFLIPNINGIEENVISEQNTNATYNLSGQKVGLNYKGIIIKNGRKEIAK